MASGNSAELQSGDGDEHFRQGAALARNGQWKEALAAYKESLRLNPNNAQTYLNLGFVYYELGYDREAQEAFDRASKLQARPCAR
jgi:Flp pilus assembly protein TadD